MAWPLARCRTGPAKVLEGPAGSQADSRTALQVPGRSCWFLDGLTGSWTVLDVGTELAGRESLDSGIAQWATKDVGSVSSGTALPVALAEAAPWAGHV